VVLLFGILYFANSWEFQVVDPIPLTDGVKQHSSVGFQKWAYYSIDAPAHKGFTLIVEHALGSNKKHDIDVYLKKGGTLPDRATYDYLNLSILNNITMDITAEPTNTKFIVGIYGFMGSNTLFTILYILNNGCPQNCNNFGFCRNNGVCACFLGHVGPYCQYNSSSVVLGNRYNVDLPAFNWLYYSVDIFSANNLQIKVEQTSAGDVDLYLRYQTIPDFLNYDHADSSTNSNFTLTVVDPNLGTWYLGFYGFFHTTFSFIIFEQRSCPMNCSLHGSCIGSTCHCSPNFIGLLCEEAVNNLNTTAVHGYVGANYWNYYKYSSNSENPFIVMLKEKDQSNNCDMYILSGAKPTKFIYQFANETLSHETEISVPHPGNTIWWIGIYGTTSCEYDIMVKMETQDIHVCNNCEHGVCRDGVCLCDSGWFGIECNVMPQVLNNSQRIPLQTILNNEWHYYLISVRNSSLLTIELSEKSTSGEVWLYLAKENFPTVNLYEASNNAPVKNHRITVEFMEPKTLRFIIGAYGSPYAINSIQYSLVAYFTPF